MRSEVTVVVNWTARLRKPRRNGLPFGWAKGLSGLKQ